MSEFKISLKMGKIISFIIQKGGCGKTTTTVNIGAYLAKSGFKTLMLDMDPQGNMTHHLGIVPETQEKTIRNVLKKEIPIEEAIIKRSENLDVIANNILTSADEITFLTAFSREYLLRDQLLKIVTNYDYILIDCPPSLGILSLNALVASHEMFIVIAPDFFPLMAIKPLMESFRIIKEKLNKALVFKGMAITMCDIRTKHTREVIEVLEHNFPDQLYHSIIRQSVSLKDASGMGKSIFEFDENSSGAIDYAQLGDEFLASHLSVQKTHLKLKKYYEKLSVEEQKQIDLKAIDGLNFFNKERYLNGERSKTLLQALDLSRNRVLKKFEKLL